MAGVAVQQAWLHSGSCCVDRHTSAPGGSNLAVPHLSPAQGVHRLHAQLAADAKGAEVRPAQRAGALQQQNAAHLPSSSMHCEVQKTHHTAVSCAQQGAQRARVGQADVSPWPSRVHKETEEQKAQYSERKGTGQMGDPVPQGLVLDAREHAHHGLQRRQRQVQAVHMVLAEGGHPHLRVSGGAQALRMGTPLFVVFVRGGTTSGGAHAGEPDWRKQGS